MNKAKTKNSEQQKKSESILEILSCTTCYVSTNITSITKSFQATGKN